MPPGLGPRSAAELRVAKEHAAVVAKLVSQQQRNLSSEKYRYLPSRIIPQIEKSLPDATSRAERYKIIDKEWVDEQPVYRLVSASAFDEDTDHEGSDRHVEILKVSVEVLDRYVSPRQIEAFENRPDSENWSAVTRARSTSQSEMSSANGMKRAAPIKPKKPVGRPPKKKEKTNAVLSPVVETDSDSASTTSTREEVPTAARLFVPDTQDQDEHYELGLKSDRRQVVNGLRYRSEKTSKSISRPIDTMTKPSGRAARGTRQDSQPSGPTMPIILDSEDEADSVLASIARSPAVKKLIPFFETKKATSSPKKISTSVIPLPEIKSLSRPRRETSTDRQLQAQINSQLFIDVKDARKQTLPLKDTRARARSSRSTTESTDAEPNSLLNKIRGRPKTQAKSTFSSETQAPTIAAPKRQTPPTVPIQTHPRRAPAAQARLRQPLISGMFGGSSSSSTTSTLLPLKRTIAQLDVPYTKRRKVTPDSVFSALEQKLAEQASDEDEEEEYEISHIVDDIVIDGQPMFLVAWKGYDETQNSYLSKSDLKGARGVLKAYMRAKQEKEKRKGKEKSS